MLVYRALTGGPQLDEPPEGGVPAVAEVPSAIRASEGAVPIGTRQPEEPPRVLQEQQTAGNEPSPAAALISRLPGPDDKLGDTVKGGLADEATELSTSQLAEPIPASPRDQYPQLLDPTADTIEGREAAESLGLDAPSNHDQTATRLDISQVQPAPEPAPEPTQYMYPTTNPATYGYPRLPSHLSRLPVMSGKSGVSGELDREDGAPSEEAAQLQGKIERIRR